MEYSDNSGAMFLGFFPRFVVSNIVNTPLHSLIVHFSYNSQPTTFSPQKFTFPTLSQFHTSNPPSISLLSSSPITNTIIPNHHIINHHHNIFRISLEIERNCYGSVSQQEVYLHIINFKMVIMIMIIT